MGNYLRSLRRNSEESIRNQTKKGYEKTFRIKRF